MRTSSLLKIRHALGHDGQSGQAMSEYIIVVAMIAIGTITAVGIIGARLRTLYAKTAMSLANAKIENTQKMKMPTGIGNDPFGSKNLSNFAGQGGRDFGMGSFRSR